jgi:branched-chain amino acid transport system ATP-binding protein
LSFLSVRELDVFYGRLHAVRGVSFQVEQGQLVTLLGANGAGKTSVIRALAGLVPIPRAIIELDGRRVDRLRPDRRVRLGIATVPEGRDLFRTLTVEENLRMGAYGRRDRGSIQADLARMYDVFPALAQKRRVHAGALSGGQGQMLAIGRALMANPRLLLLDEPSHGLAPNLVEEIFRLIPRLQHERDLTTFLVEQNANKALSVASYGYVLEAGSLMLEGTTAELAHDPRVKQLYLGG